MVALVNANLLSQRFQRLELKRRRITSLDCDYFLRGQFLAGKLLGHHADHKPIEMLDLVVRNVRRCVGVADA